MAPTALKSMYKVKSKDENTISSRRISRGLERKQSRHDEVNKRRRLSDDEMMMSPVSEDNFNYEDRDMLNRNHQKTPTRLERLRQWQEKRRALKEKDSKKPLFIVSKKTEIKLASEIFNQQKSTSKAVVKTVSVKPAEIKAIPTQNQKSAAGGGNSESRRNKASQPTNAQVVSTLHAVSSQPSMSKGSTVEKTTRELRSKTTDLSKKLTASTAAKVKTDEKTRDFLRAKPRSTLNTVLNQRKENERSKNSNKDDSKSSKEVNTMLRKPEKARVIVSDTTDAELCPIIEQTDTSDTQLPVAEHAIQRSPAIGKRRSTRIKASVSYKTSDADSETELKTVKYPKTPRLVSHSLSSEDSEETQTIHYPGTPRFRKQSEQISLEDQETRSTLVSVSNEGTSCVIENERSKNSNKDDSKSSEEVNTMLRKPKKARVIVTDTADAELCPIIEQADASDTQLPVAEHAIQRSPAIGKRRSTRIKGSVSYKTSDADSETELKTVKYPKTPRLVSHSLSSEDSEETQTIHYPGTPRFRKQSEQISLEDQETRSTLVSVSNEGTSCVIGDNVVDKMELQVTPKHMQHLSVTAKSVNLRRSTRRSVVIDISDQGTSVLDDHESCTSYVEKPTESQMSNHVLRELDVEMGGEDSFIEADETLKDLLRAELKSTLRAQQQNENERSKNSNKDDSKSSEEVNTMLRKPKKTRVIVSDAADTELCSIIEQTDAGDTQLPVAEHVIQRSPVRSQITSAIAKRRSTRIKAMVSYRASDAGSETELKFVQYPKTPRRVSHSLSSEDSEETQTIHYPGTPRFRKQSERISLENQENRSTFVSVSNEGTSGVIGNVVELQATPKHTQHLTVNAKSGNLRRSIHRSEIIDIYEGTASSGDHVSCTAYYVEKPADSEMSDRVLQELAVEKCEGETSFIEVDESVDTNFDVENASLRDSVVPQFQILQEDNIDSTTADEETDQSTQPFTPRRSSDMSQMTVSSSQDNATPVTQFVTTPVTSKSQRTRGKSLNRQSFFKTPGQPASAARTRSESKRRKTEQSEPLKSPEEMIELLKKSPMIEMSRRKSRLLTQAKNPTSLTTLLASLDTSNPQLSHSLVSTTVDTVTTSVENVSCNSLPETVVSLIPQPIEESQVNLNDGVKGFRDLLLSETNKLNQLCSHWSEISISSASLKEEALGHILSTVGKAQLLMDQRFKQFSGLVDNCEFNLGEKETTLTDLQGFWEMIYFQVQDVNMMFAQLAEWQQKNWEIEQTIPAKVVPKRKVVKGRKQNVVSNFSGFREELMKRKAKAKEVKITENDSGTTKVFDAGFFNVTSPVKSPSSRKSQQNVPLMPVTSEQPSCSSEEDFTQVVEKPVNIQNDRPGTPTKKDNKENVTSTPKSEYVNKFSKRFSYLPAIPSPLLNDITGLLSKKT